MFTDPSGCFFLTALIVGAIVGTLVGFGGTVLADYVDDGQIFNGSISAGSYIANTLVGGVIGAVIGATLPSMLSSTANILSNFLSNSFTFAVPQIAGSTIAMGTISVTGAQIAIVGTGVLGGTIAFSKGFGPRMGHNQHENQMWDEAMRQLGIKDKDLIRRLHQEKNKYPYQEKLKGLMTVLKEILLKWGK